MNNLSKAKIKLYVYCFLSSRLIFYESFFCIHRFTFIADVDKKFIKNKTEKIKDQEKSSVRTYVREIKIKHNGNDLIYIKRKTKNKKYMICVNID